MYVAVYLYDTPKSGMAPVDIHCAKVVNLQRTCLFYCFTAEPQSTQRCEPVVFALWLCSAPDHQIAKRALPACPALAQQHIHRARRSQ
jgi:hypothetical protein